MALQVLNWISRNERDGLRTRYHSIRPVGTCKAYLPCLVNGNSHHSTEKMPLLLSRVPLVALAHALYLLLQTIPASSQSSVSTDLAASLLKRPKLKLARNMLSSHVRSNLRDFEVQTSNPQLGLAISDYEWLVHHGTHIVHNAWPMSGTRPISTF
jgi:hypothetical protein